MTHFQNIKTKTIKLRLLNAMHFLVGNEFNKSELATGTTNLRLVLYIMFECLKSTLHKCFLKKLSWKVSQTSQDNVSAGVIF